MPMKKEIKKSSIAHEAVIAAHEVAIQAADAAAKVSTAAAQATDDKDFILGQQVAHLQGTVEAGFKAVTDRQDIANHRTDKNENAIDGIITAMAKQRGKADGLSLAWKIIYTIITLVLAFLALFHWGRLPL